MENFTKNNVQIKIGEGAVSNLKWSSTSTNVLATEEIQDIGADMGRSHAKGYTEYRGVPKSTIFKSLVGTGQALENWESYNDINPMCIRINDSAKPYFVGEMAFQSNDKRQNAVDAKTNNLDFEVLFANLLNELAVSSKVRINLGVPKKLYKKSVFAEVINSYKGKIYKIEDLVNGGVKEIEIVDIIISKEAVAGAAHLVKLFPELKKTPFAVAILGHRTLETAYYDFGYKYNNLKSIFRELGAITALQTVQTELASQGKMFELEEIEADPRFSDMIKWGEQSTIQKLNGHLEQAWINLDEETQPIFCMGGTMMNLKQHSNFPYRVVNDAQMMVAMGLFDILNDLEEVA